jgi:hypothetical protein
MVQKALKEGKFVAASKGNNYSSGFVSFVLWG